MAFTIIPEEHGKDRIQAVFLKSHLGMMALGMRNSRMTGTQLLRKASDITGKHYRRGQYAIAKQDIAKWLEDNQ